MVETGTDELAELKTQLSQARDKSNIGIFLLPAMIGLVVIIGLVWLTLSGRGNDTIQIGLEEFSAGEMVEGDAWKVWATQNAIASYLEAHDAIEVSDANDAGSRADWVMSGGLSGADDDAKSLLLRIELTSVNQEDVSFAAEIPGVSESLNDMAVRAAGQVLAWSGHDLISDEPIQFAEDELPISRDAIQLFSEGKAAFAQSDDRRAVASYERAIEISGDHPLIYLELARAWDRLGYRPKALETLQKAFETRSVLSRRKQLEIEAEFHTLDHDWSAARDAWFSLKSFYPSELEFWLNLGEVNLKQSEVDEVYSLLEEMRGLPEPIGSDPRIDILEGDYWYHKGDYAKGEAVTLVAIEKARALGERHVLAEALLQMVSFTKFAGIEYLEEAEAIYRADADILNVAETLGHKAGMNRIAGRLNEAETLFLEAIGLSDEIGDEAVRSINVNGLVIVYDLMGRQSESLELKRELAAYLKDRGIDNRHGIMLENIGISNFKLGRLDEAELSFKSALDVFGEVDDLIGIAWHPQHMSRIMSRRGDLKTARSLAKDAFARSSERPEGDLAGNSEFEIAHIDFFEGNFAASRERFTRIRDGFKSYENHITVGEVDHMLSRINFRVGDMAGAQEELDKARAFFEADALPNYQLKSLITQVDLSFATDRKSLGEDCAALQGLVKKSEFLEFTLKARSRLIRCAVKFDGQDFETALIDLLALRENAKQTGFFEAHLESYTQAAWIASDLELNEEALSAASVAIELAKAYQISLQGMLPQ